jgi:hypothetical protein
MFSDYKSNTDDVKAASYPYIRVADAPATHLDHGSPGLLAGSTCQSNLPMSITAGDSCTEAEFTSSVCAVGAANSSSSVMAAVAGASTAGSGGLLCMLLMGGAKLGAG